jgi:hypothetical protein
MTHAPTVQEFMTSPEPDEDETLTVAYVEVPTIADTPAPEVPELGHIVPPAMAEHTRESALVWIAESLATIAEASHVSAYLDKQATFLGASLEEAERELADVQALVDAQTDLLARVREIVKPSTSKLANSVRDVLTLFGGPEAAQEPTGEHNNDQDAPPAADAKVEEWRAFARGRGYAGPDVDKANRSQIRTMLGLPHAEPTS